MHNLLLCFAFSALLMGSIKAQSPDSTMVCENNCCCAIAVPTPAGLMYSHVHSKGEWMISYRLMNMGMEGLRSGTSTISNNDVFNQYLMSPKNMQSNMHMLMAMYGVNSRLTLMLMANYISNSMEMLMFPGSGMNMPGMTVSPTESASTSVSSGFGDFKVHALYHLLSSKKHQLILSAGVNIPTGNIHYLGASDDMMYSHKRMPYSMQLGSGSFDALPAIGYSYRKEELAAGVQLSGVYRMYHNQLGYRLGNEATANLWFAYRWLKLWSSSLRIETGMNDKIQGNDPLLYYYYEPSANPNNYGGQRTLLYMGTTVQINKGFLKNNKIGAEYGFPLYQRVNGIQAPVKSMINVYWSLNF